MRIKLDEEEDVQVQMAPLIDCVFLLLTFFLVASTLKKVEKVLPIELPDSAAAKLAQESPDVLVIAVDSNGRTYIGSELVSTDALHGRLRGLSLTNPRQRIRIDGDRRAPFQYVVRVMDLCQFNGLRNIGVRTRRESAGE